MSLLTRYGWIRNVYFFEMWQLLVGQVQATAPQNIGDDSPVRLLPVTYPLHLY